VILWHVGLARLTPNVGQVVRLIRLPPLEKRRVQTKPVKAFFEVQNLKLPFLSHVCRCLMRAATCSRFRCARVSAR
jgi:hypothetical protein